MADAGLAVSMIEEGMKIMKKYKNLIIVGNGFDRWQNLPTSYENFRLYYQDHIISAAEALGCSFYTVIDKTGKEQKLTAVELIYGDILNPGNLEDEFFWNLEARMDRMNDQAINLHFGRSEEGRKALKKAVSEATLLLRKLFCDWVGTIEIEEKNSGFVFGDDCFVINFNYTDTLEKRFGVDARNDFHIHGSASDLNSIVVGHASHPEKPFSELIEHRFIRSEDPKKGLPRLEGLYAVEAALYETDKHVVDRMDDLCVAFMENGVHMEDIENIYVLGHSFAPADSEYFEFLHAVTRCNCNYEALSPVGHMDREMLGAMLNGNDEVLMAGIILNLQYAERHSNRLNPEQEDWFAYLDEGCDDKMPYDEKLGRLAVEQRFWMEQAERTQNKLEKLAEKYGKKVPANCHSILGYMEYVDGGHIERKHSANWHISCFSSEDRKRIKRVTRDLHIKNVKCYQTIDACIGKFAVEGSGNIENPS